MYRVNPLAYARYEGLGIPVDSAVALRTWKTEMLVPNCIGAYRSKAVSWPLLAIATYEQKMRAVAGILEPKQNFYSLTVSTLDQYLKYYSQKTVSLP